jgi:hypothetical protein
MKEIVIENREDFLYKKAHSLLEEATDKEEFFSDPDMQELLADDLSLLPFS